MSGTVHATDASCPDCGNTEAVVRVRGNAMSSVCTACRRVDVAPMLDGPDLSLIADELEGELFELEAARTGCAVSLSASVRRELALLDGDFGHASLSVELRLPVPPR